MDSAEASVRDLTGLVQEVLRNNVNMALRLKNLERMHPAFASSRSVSHIERRPSDKSEMRAVNRTTCYNFAFEDELKASAVYKRALLRNMRISTSSGSSNGPSWFSGLSLSDVSNVSALALPIYRTELWNHRHYTLEATASKVTATSLEAWYNPPAKVRSLIQIDHWGRADIPYRKAHSFERLTSTVNTPTSMHNRNLQAILCIDALRSLRRTGRPFSWRA